MSGPKMSEPQQRLLVGAIAGLVLAMCFAGSFLAAFHEPSPHRLPVAVVASAPEVRQLEAGLNAHLRGALEVVPSVVELRGGGPVSELSQTGVAATSGAAGAMVV